MDRAAVVEVLDRAGQVRAVHKILQWPARIGRSPGCELVLDDGHLAAEHAELDWREGEGASLRLLPSLNGGWLGERRLQAGESAALSGNALFQLGATQLRWRSTTAALAPELPLQQHQRDQRVGKRRYVEVAGLLLLWLSLMVLDHWAGRDPGTPWINSSSALLGPLGALLAWAGLWSLITQLFQHRFPFALHLRFALLALLAGILLDNGLPLLAYAFSLPRLLALSSLLGMTILGLLLWRHASLAWPRGRRTLALSLAAMLLLAEGLGVAKRQEQQHWFGPLYLSQLPPPALRVATPKPPASLIDALRPLEAELARQAGKDAENAEPDGDD